MISVLRKTVTTPGSPVWLWDDTFRWTDPVNRRPSRDEPEFIQSPFAVYAHIELLPGSGSVVLGNKHVIAAEATRRGLTLSPGERLVAWNLDLRELYLDALSADDGVGVFYTEGAVKGAPRFELHRPSVGIGTGDVVGPTSSTDFAIVRFSGMGGKTLQNSSATISDNGVLSLDNNLNLKGNSIISGSAQDIPITPGSTGNLILDGLKWPQADGSALQHLETDGSAQTSWADPLLLYPAYISGRYYWQARSRQAADFTLTADRLFAVPFGCLGNTTFDRIAIEVMTIDGFSNARLGIYNVGSDGLPHDLVEDCGTVSLATTGAKEIVISVTLDRKWYYLVILSDSSIAKVEALRMDWGFAVLGSANAAGNSSGLIRRVQAYGALPNPFGGSLTFEAVTNPPGIALRSV